MFSLAAVWMRDRFASPRTCNPGLAQMLGCGSNPEPARRCLLQRVFERADINPMPLRHHDQECLETRVVYRADVFFDLANHLSLAPIQQ
jgi:hypothetical protein